MTKAVQISLLAGGLVATALIMGLVVFAATFDINDYKARIARAVKDETGRTLTFTGDIGLMLFPRIGVTVDGAELSNAPGFGSEPMARVGMARATFLLRPLLSGEVRIGTVMLDGLALNLARSAQGVTNWDDLTGGKDGPSTTGGDFSLEVDGVEIKDASVAWDDRKADLTMTVQGVSLDIGAVRPGVPFPVKGGLAFRSSRPEVTGSATFAATVSLDGGDRFGLRGASASLSAEGAAVPGGKADVQATVDEADGGAGLIKLKGLAVTAYGATVHFDGSVAGLAEGVETLAGVLTLDPCDGRKVLMALTGAEPDTADKAALAKVGGTANVAYTPRSVAIKELSLDVDGNGLRGDVNVSGGDEGVSCYARLDADTVDVDRYLPPKRDEAAESAAAGPESRWLRSDRLQRLTVDAEAAFARLHAGGVWMQNVRATVKGRNGLVRVSPVEADLYGGKLSLAATVNALTNRPKTDLLVSLDKVDVGALSRDALGDRSYGGILDLKGALSCEGDRASAMLGSMNGKFRMDLADGVFPGVDLLGLARTTQTSRQKEGTVEASDADSTRFGSITGTGVIRSGVLDNRDLAVKAPGLRADGEGAVSLLTGRINYLLKVKLVPSSEGQGGADSKDMFGIMVPVRVTGTVDDPKYSVSLSEYVKALGGAVVGVAGTVVKGVTGAISTVGEMVTGGKGEEETTTEKRKNGLHNLFGLF